MRLGLIQPILGWAIAVVPGYLNNFSTNDSDRITRLIAPKGHADSFSCFKCSSRSKRSSLNPLRLDGSGLRVRRTILTYSPNNKLAKRFASTPFLSFSRSGFRVEQVLTCAPRERNFIYEGWHIGCNAKAVKLYSKHFTAPSSNDILWVRLATRSLRLVKPA